MRIFLSLFVCLAMTLPVAAQEATGPIATGREATTDAEIGTRIREILDALGNYQDVSVEVDEGVVTLRGTATSIAEADELKPLANRVEGVVAVRNTVTETTDVGARLSPAVDRFRARLEQTITMLPLLLIALGVFAIIVMLGFFIARLRQPWERLAPNAFIAEIYRQLLRIGFVGLGLIVALDILNATALLTPILGAAGIVGLAIGFAVRDTVENFIASIMLSIRQPFRPNDAIEINGDEGKVIRLTSRATILLSYDGNHIHIPNSTVFKSRMVNFTRNAERRIRFEIGVASDADLSAIRDLATKTVREMPFTLDEPTPLTWIDRIGDGAIFLTVTGWIDQTKTSLVRAQGETLRQVKNAIEDAGVEVPDTTYRIQMVGGSPMSITSEATPPTPKPTPRPEAAVADVAASNDEDLEKIIDAERADKNQDDLLSQDAKPE